MQTGLKGGKAAETCRYRLNSLVLLDRRVRAGNLNIDSDSLTSLAAGSPRHPRFRNSISAITVPHNQLPDITSDSASRQVGLATLLPPKPTTPHLHYPFLPKPSPQPPRTMSATPTPRTVHDPLLFEVAWEVANKVGGIYTVIKTKAPVTVAEYGSRYTLIGPLSYKTAPMEVENVEP
jgi:hypothetical protein